MPPTTIEPAALPKRAFERAVRNHLAGRLDDAARCYREALALAPDFAEACNNLGSILGERGEAAEALTLFRRACEIAPNYGEAQNNVGLILTRMGRHADATPAFRAACESDPTRADWANNLANNCVECFRFDEALTQFDRAVRLRPDDAEFWNNRALALRGLRRVPEALASLERSLELNPTGTNALSNLGVMLREERRLHEAIAVFERATAAAPNHAPTLTNFASVYELLGDFDRVRELANRARELDPGFAEPFVLLANCELEAGHYDACVDLLRQCLAIDPDNRNANWNQAILSLLRGDFETGWRQFESRKLLQSTLIDHASYNAPEWDGSPLVGRRILLHTEQGVGDAIQFVRFASLLKSRGAGRVIIECPFPIVPLLQGVDGVDEVIARGAPLPEYDVHAFLMSLPYLLGVRLETIPARVPYIPTEPRSVSALIDAPASVLKVGIVWAGNPAHHRDRLRSVSPTAFAPLMTIPGVAWYSLQKGDQLQADLAMFPPGRVKDVGSHLADFRDTSAVLDRLDLVISVDTSVAHLAGALGRPTWTLLSHVPDFRWLLDRADSPWYPTMRLFRQPEPGAWAPVISNLESALQEMVMARSSAATNDAGRAAPVTSVESAMRLPDGRPRFDLWLPIASLADAPAFAAYEAELVQGGYDRPLREFWDEGLRVVDTFMDAAPGLGLTLFSVLTAGTRTNVVAIEPSAPAADRLMRLARDRGMAGRLTIDSALRVPPSVGRAAVRCETAEQFVAALGAFRSANALDALWMIAMSQGVPDAVRSPLTALAQHGYLAFEVTHADGEVTLDLVDAWDRAQDFVVLSKHAVESLSRPVTAAPRGSPEQPRTTPGAAELVPAGFTSRIAIDWELRSDTGWGVYGTHLAHELARHDGIEPNVFTADLRDATPIDRWHFRRVRSVALAASASLTFDGLVLHGLGNNFAHGPLWDRVRGRRRAGVIFFEDTAFDAESLDRARSLDAIIAGSSWNADVLRARGLDRVHVVQQGVDATVFHPAPASGRFADRFVIFSGGKLEYRKGQDLVVAAFRIFRERHPEAVLLTTWHNPWPHLITDLALAGHVRGSPEVRGGALDVTSWLAANGIPPEAVIDVGRAPNEAMGRIVREAHVALFPNRCEGGTNLVAMECMASGVPTIVSANTGHLDLVAAGGCVPLDAQQPVRPPTRFFRSTDGWGESSIDEIVAALETAWSDRARTRAIAADGAQVMRGWTWRSQVDRLVNVLRPLF